MTAVIYFINTAYVTFCGIWCSLASIVLLCVSNTMIYLVSQPLHWALLKKTSGRFRFFKISPFQSLEITAFLSFVFEYKVTAHTPCIYTICNRSSNQPSVVTRDIIVTTSCVIQLLRLPNMDSSVTSHDFALMRTDATVWIEVSLRNMHARNRYTVHSYFHALKWVYFKRAIASQSFLKIKPNSAAGNQVTLWLAPMANMIEFLFYKITEREAHSLL